VSEATGPALDQDPAVIIDADETFEATSQCDAVLTYAIPSAV
jgi:hypothetical protein